MNDIYDIDIRRIDGGLLLVFRELCRRGRTTDAALRLGLSQSAVSHALGRLRDIFGDPLFVRRPHGLDPTARALELAPRVDALIDLLGAAVRPDGAFDAALSSRRFHVAATEFAVGLVTGRLIQRMRSTAPRASFTLQYLRGYIALEALRRGEIDLALGSFGNVTQEFVAEMLFEDRYCVVARRGHPTLRGAIDVPQYAETGHVYVSSFQGNLMGPADGEHPLPDPKIVVTTAVVPRWEMALALVSTSDAIATCPRRLAEQQSGTLGLQVLEPPFDVPTFTVSAVRRADSDAGLEWFAGEVRAASL